MSKAVRLNASSAGDYTEELQRSGSGGPDLRGSRMHLNWNSFVPSTPLRLYLPPAESSFAYSDGLASEQYLESVLHGTNDLSEGSAALRRAQVDWPSMYHFSSKRGNLVRWLGNLAGQRVLEIGAGCGAVTRSLAEMGAEVVAVEGSAARARIAALRCRDRDNVQVYVANAQNIAPDPTFDVATLIGVLEYAGKYVRSTNPWLEMLRVARSFLKDSGVLILAIENKVGVKYWTGCTEDHGAGMFSSIQDYPNHDPVRTFSEAELSDLLVAAGLPFHRTLYPWPDYKIPDAIIARPERGLHLANWVSPQFHDYSGKKQAHMEDALVVASLDKAGLLGALSNSFLMLASARPLSETFSPSWIAKAFAVERARPFWTETTFDATAQRVHKTRLSPSSPPASAGFVFRPESGPWFRGELVEAEWTRCASVGDVEGFLKVVRHYRGAVRAAFAVPQAPAGPLLLRGEAWDALPRNAVVGDRGVSFFDLEWHATQPFPEEMLLFRALHRWCVDHPLALQKLLAMPAVEALFQLMKAVYADFTSERLRTYAAEEQAFLQWVRGV